MMQPAEHGRRDHLSRSLDSSRAGRVALERVVSVRLVSLPEIEQREGEEEVTMDLVRVSPFPSHGWSLRLAHEQTTEGQEEQPNHQQREERGHDSQDRVLLRSPDQENESRSHDDSGNGQHRE